MGRQYLAALSAKVEVVGGGKEVKIEGDGGTGASWVEDWDPCAPMSACHSQIADPRTGNSPDRGDSKPCSSDRCVGGIKIRPSDARLRCGL